MSRLKKRRTFHPLSQCEILGQRAAGCLRIVSALLPAVLPGNQMIGAVGSNTGQILLADEPAAQIVTSRFQDDPTPPDPVIVNPGAS